LPAGWRAKYLISVTLRSGGTSGSQRWMLKSKYMVGGERDCFGDDGGRRFGEFRP
jgi:hypothetical protein